jgi:LmbE family N-acetylglucosaminyl deacetylase
MFDGDSKILVVGAHPDDEVLGVGGTMAKHAKAGDDVHVLIATEGTTQQYNDESIVEEKRDHARECANVLGVEQVHFGDLPDMRLQETPHVELNALIEDVISEVQPDIVYTHSRREVNLDHVAIHDSTIVATRPTSCVSKVLAYETPSSTDFAVRNAGFQPSLFVDVTAFLDDKIEAFEQYDNETRAYPHPRSPRALRAIAHTRGVASGVHAAEAFDELRTYR